MSKRGSGRSFPDNMGLRPVGMGFLSSSHERISLILLVLLARWRFRPRLRMWRHWKKGQTPDRLRAGFAGDERQSKTQIEVWKGHDGVQEQVQPLPDCLQRMMCANSRRFQEVDETGSQTMR